MVSSPILYRNGPGLIIESGQEPKVVDTFRRGISQEKLPDCLGFFQFVHNARRRGKALLGALVR